MNGEMNLKENCINFHILIISFNEWIREVNIGLNKTDDVTHKQLVSKSK